MTILFSGLQAVLAGVPAEKILAPPADSKQAGLEQVFRVSMDATVFPVGATTLSLGISVDGGATYKTSSMTCTGGLLPRSGKWTMNYALGANAVPTHTKVSINAPLGFTSNMTVEAL
jgi:streptogramin lyase